MEIVFPVSMLALGLTIGAASLWFITRTKLKYEFERGRAHGETERAVLQTRLEEERKANQEKITLLHNAEIKLADAFKALSADALRNNNQSFMDIAKQNLQSFDQKARGELQRRQKALDDLKKPF
jgi:DNA anti-recombination protein RmuC